MGFENRGLLTFIYIYTYICTYAYVYMHTYICRYIYLHVQLHLSKFTKLCSQPFFKTHQLEKMEICSHFSALVPERGHHKVQDRAGAAGEPPQGTDASAREEGPELRGGE